jgi:hypothetical protein
MKEIEETTAAVTWLITITVFILYINYYHQLRSVGEAILAMAPAIIFFTGAVLIYNRDRGKIRRAREKQEYSRSTELDWGQALKHDLLTYLTPVLILALPLFFGQLPNLITVFQACAAFLALSYLKFIYWGEL